MRCLARVAPFAPIILLGLGAPAEAGSVHVHHSQARINAIELNDYEKAVRSRDRDPAKFDQIHPLGGQLLSSELVYEKLLAEWKAHPLKFELEHKCLWHVLAGDEIYHEMHPVVPPNPPGGITEFVIPNPPPGNENPPPGGGPPNDPPSGSVPEPSSGILMFSALVVALVAAARRRAWTRFKSAPGAAA
jgi:hypothetical protein